MSDPVRGTTRWRVDLGEARGLRKPLETETERRGEELFPPAYFGQLDDKRCLRAGTAKRGRGRGGGEIGCAHLHPCPRRCTDKRGGCRACARRRPLVVGPRPPRPNRRRHVPQSAHEARCAAAAAGYRTVGRPSSTRPATAPNLGTKSHGKSRYTRPLPRLSPDDK